MLKVNEVFGPTIQGEGPSQGRYVMFLRLALCNLSCQWCDTKYTWDWKNYDRTKEIHELDNDVLLRQLDDPCEAVVISGGEPLLQQRKLLNLVGGLKKKNYWVEIETNGTIVPERVLLDLVDQVNCSPKLSNSGDSRRRRIKSEALKVLSESSKVYFKFVIGSLHDIDEVLEYVETFKIKPSHVYLMPLGKTREELQATSSMARLLAREYSFIYSSRLHVELYGTKRGV